MPEIVTWVLAAGSLAGAWLNSKQKVSGFYIWLPVNILWGIVAIQHGLIAQSILWGVYAGICVNGIYQWRKKRHGTKD